MTLICKVPAGKDERSGVQSTWRTLKLSQSTTTTTTTSDNKTAFKVLKDAVESSGSLFHFYKTGNGLELYIYNMIR